MPKFSRKVGGLSSILSFTLAVFAGVAHYFSLFERLDLLVYDSFFSVPLYSSSIQSNRDKDIVIFASC